jgi:hypothetical protein
MHGDPVYHGGNHRHGQFVPDPVEDPECGGDGGGPTGIAMVEADHEGPLRRETVAKLVRPTQHRGRGPHDQNWRRIAPAAEPLGG